MRWAPVLVLLGGCYRAPADPVCEITFCNDPGDDAGPGDDSGGGDGPAEVCAGDVNGFLPTTCFKPVPALRQLGSTLDTSNDPQCDRVLASPPICIVVTDKVSGDLSVVGQRALVLWAPSTLAVAGRIDAASHNMVTKAGPGADQSCATGAGVMGGGGAGGSFGTGGGAGGPSVGNGGNPTGFQSGLGLHRGCDGGAGGAPGGGSGGLSGGAIYLMAHTSIAVSGQINASGGGGFAPGMSGGGGGGGSGGLIGLDAPAVTIATGASVYAVGGGGSSGGNTTFNGRPGDEASCCPILGAQRAGATEGNNFGGTGATFSTSGEGGGPGDGGTNAGGGGGGGGAGVIVVFPPSGLSNNGAIDPLPVTP